MQKYCSEGGFVKLPKMGPKSSAKMQKTWRISLWMAPWVSFHSPAAEHPVLVADVIRLEEARGDGRHQRRDAVRVQVQLRAEAVTRAKIA